MVRGYGKRKGGSSENTKRRGREKSMIGEVRRVMAARNLEKLEVWKYDSIHLYEEMNQQQV